MPTRDGLNLCHILAIGQEAALEFYVIHFLNDDARIDRNRGGGSCGLAEDHEYRLHADRAVRDMAGGKTNRNQEIRAFT